MASSSRISVYPIGSKHYLNRVSINFKCIKYSGSEVIALLELLMGTTYQSQVVLSRLILGYLLN